MVDSVNSISGAQAASSNSEVMESAKTEETGLFEEDETSSVGQKSEITEDEAMAIIQSYIENMKKQYPQMAAKLDFYYSHIDVSTIIASGATSASDIYAYIFNETQKYMQ